MRPQLAEMPLDLRYRGSPDSFRKRHPFSEDIESVHAILFSSNYNRRKKRAVYTRWLEGNQPCVFGRITECAFSKAMNSASGRVAWPTVNTTGSESGVVIVRANSGSALS